METLIDFINLTKGVEYIIAVLFLVTFPVFWKYLNGNPRHREEYDE